MARIFKEKKYLGPNCFHYILECINNSVNAAQKKCPDTKFFSGQYFLEFEINTEIYSQLLEIFRDLLVDWSLAKKGIYHNIFLEYFATAICRNASG